MSTKHVQQRLLLGLPCHCTLCERDDIPAKEMARNGFCLLCQRDYMAFRKAYKTENGRFPTMAEFRSEEEI